MKTQQTLANCLFETPLGKFWLWANDEGLVYAAFRKPTTKEAQALGLMTKSAPSKKAEQILKQAKTSLKRYFLGELAALDAVPVTLKTGTGFQQAAWKTLRKIPAGTTWSYSQLASKIKSPAAVRAIGSACRNNPLCLFLPCHRVVGKDKSLTGYNGGIEKKKFLLAHEGARGLLKNP